MKTGIMVSDAMTANPISIPATKTIFECAKIMVKKRVGSLLIVKDKTLLGIITEKDLVNLLAKGLDANKIKARDIMMKKIHSINPEEDLYDALLQMKREKVRRLPVVKNKTLWGMLTFNDIMKLQPALFDILIEKGNIRTHNTKEKFIEGSCEVCENFGKLSEIDGQYMCTECQNEHINSSLE